MLCYLFVGLHNEITIWNAKTKKHIAIDATDVLLGMASTSSCAASTVMCVTTDDRARYFAVGTGSGLITVWSIDLPAGMVRVGFDTQLFCAFARGGSYPVLFASYYS